MKHMGYPTPERKAEQAILSFLNGPQHSQTLILWLDIITSLKACSHYESNLHWKRINSHHTVCALPAICIEYTFSQSTFIGGLKVNCIMTYL